MQLNYKANLENLRKQQLDYVESNIQEIDKHLSDGKIAEAYSALLLSAKSGYMKTFANFLLGREVEKALADSSYHIFIDDYYMNFYNSKAVIKFSTIPSDKKIVIVGSSNNSELAERAKVNFAHFTDAGWEIEELK